MLSSEIPLVRASMEPGARPTVPPSEPSMRLAEWKRRVPAAREALGPKAWNGLVNATPIATRGPSTTASRAYHKLKEIFLSCALPPPARSLHLCEAPGGFVQATAEFAAPGWEWCGVSCAEGPEPATSLLPMHAGRFVVADVFDLASPVSDACLVTCDGAHVLSEHEHLEKEHFPLLVAQTNVGLSALRPEGCFVCKFFEGARPETMHWIAWLTNAFEEVSLIKPTSSRPTNSERYIVARGFKGTPDYSVDDAGTSREWLSELRHTLSIFDNAQASALESLLHKVERVIRARDKVERL